MHKFTNVGMVHRNAFHDICAKYVAPSVEMHWRAQQKEIIRGLQTDGVIVIGDARMDSPGHTAAYCTYTLMEYETKNILASVFVDKRQTHLKSPNMEKEGLIKALKEVKAMGIVVKELVTDGHIAIAKMMSKYSSLSIVICLGMNQN